MRADAAGAIHLLRPPRVPRRSPPLRRRHSRIRGSLAPDPPVAGASARSQTGRLGFAQPLPSWSRSRVASSGTKPGIRASLAAAAVCMRTVIRPKARSIGPAVTSTNCMRPYGTTESRLYMTPRRTRRSSSWSSAYPHALRSAGARSAPPPLRGRPPRPARSPPSRPLPAAEAATTTITTATNPTARIW